MARSTKTADETREKILKLCAKGYLTPMQVAEALGMLVNSVRSYYVYKMAAEGLLVKAGQTYKKA